MEPPPGSARPPFFRKLAHDEKEALLDIRNYFRRRGRLLAAIPVSIQSLTNHRPATVSDLDVWRAANLLICKHGANAEFEAAKRADVMLYRGDDDGRLLWARISRAIEDLQAPRRGRLN